MKYIVLKSNEVQIALVNLEGKAVYPLLLCTLYSKKSTLKIFTGFEIIEQNDNIIIMRSDFYTFVLLSTCFIVVFQVYLSLLFHLHLEYFDKLYERKLFAHVTYLMQRMRTILYHFV